MAGASAALRLARDRQRQITVVTRAADPEESNCRGLGRIYRHTTNPKGARGDGLAMACRDDTKGTAAI